MAGAGDANSNWISDRTFGHFLQSSQRIAWPGGAGHIEEGAAERGGFEVALAREAAIRKLTVHVNAQSDSGLVDGIQVDTP